MRMEELENNMYEKKTDTVEKYLLDLIKKYFENNTEVNTNTQEYIIQKAVSRMKSELNIDNAGVVSINGQTGDIIITCDTLGAEPFIADKKTAFNVDFGNEPGTACRGNDPRLSDARIPLSHNHSISEISGLQGQLSSIQNMINIVQGISHNHANKAILDKLIYTGNSSVINLDAIDTINQMIEQKIIEVDSLIEVYTNDLNELLNDMQERLNELS